MIIGHEWVPGVLGPFDVACVYTKRKRIIPGKLAGKNGLTLPRGETRSGAGIRTARPGAFKLSQPGSPFFVI
jgi:hypothetical protein